MQPGTCMHGELLTLPVLACKEFQTKTLADVMYQK